MVGSVDDTYLSELHQRDAGENQQSLFDFSKDDEQETTTIAVVTKPTGGIQEATDEFIPELGMPEWKLDEFQNAREDMSGDDVERHNRAFEACELEESYMKYLSTDEKAQEALQRLQTRLDNGENLTLVCFEKPPKRCHRTVLRRVLEERLVI